MGVHLGVWGFIPSHSFALPGVRDVTIGLPSWLATLQAFVLVVNPRLGLRHLPTYSMMPCNALNLGSSWKTHILCVPATLKVTTKVKKGSNTLITSSAILPYKISNSTSNSPHIKGKFSNARAWYSLCILLQIENATKKASKSSQYRLV